MCDWVFMNINNFLVDGRDTTPGPCYGKIQDVPEAGGKVAFIFPTAFNKACEDEGISPKALLSHLNTKGLLYTDKTQRGLKKVTKIGGDSVRTCAVILSRENAKNSPEDEEYPF